MPIQPIRSLETLLEAIDQGLEPSYCMFWGHTEPLAGPPGPGKYVLSQWWPASFVVEDVLYPTAEHYMMAEKARLFGDQDAVDRIMATASPGEAKKLGRGVRGFSVEIWAPVSFDIVVRGNEAKFGQHPNLREYLLGTGDAVLVEASPWDQVWGIGLRAGDPDARDPATWKGQNLLGFALMEVRSRLR